MSGAAGVSIRRAGTADAPMLAALFRAELEAQQQQSGNGFALRPDFDWAAWVAAKLAAPNTAVFVAERGGKAVGFVEARCRKAGPVQAQRHPAWRRLARRLLRGSSAAASPAVSPMEPRSAGFVEEIFVEPDSRRHGIASELLGTARQWLNAAGSDELLASIWWDNDASRALFTKAGFTASRVVMRAGNGR